TEVDALRETLEDEGLESPAVRQQLADLRQSSVDLIDENPFALANKSGTLERIKKEMRDRTGQDSSSKEAFRTFWSFAYLQTNSWSDEIEFFNAQIRPRIETNYWRSIGFNGLPTDRFWVIDLPFVALFALEYFVRTLYLSRRHANTTWFDAMLWRIYDVPLFVPFWRWLRVIPVVIRSNQAQLSHLDPIQGRINRILISQFAVELTEVVFLRILDQIQNLIREGQLSRWMFELTSQGGYIDLNDVNEVQTIAQRVSDIVVNKVLPEIKPEIDALLTHSVTGALAQAPAYQGLQLLPGFTSISVQLTQQISAEVSKNLYGALKQALADEQGAALVTKLIDSFGRNLRHEMRQGNTLTELEDLLNDLLEEVKVNYVERIAEHDTETRRADSYRLYSTTQKARPTPAKLVGR
ncbi:MAG: hypothetical protein F6K31_39130, partial [Symploca sp. SIO2G7]|nr:hypothetical protein [Symploca sp. SIO2G7]